MPSIKTALDVSFHAHGVDIQQTHAVELAIKRGIIARICNIKDDPLPYQDNTFDVVFCTEVVEHTFNPIHIIREVNRVLKKGGIFIFSVPNVAAWQKRLLLLVGRNIYYAYDTTKK